MIPYLLAENPELTEEEVFRLTKRMMDEHKLEAFVLDLSFLGWALLGALTLGILNLIFTNPYKAATDAELFRWLNGERDITAPQPEYMDETEITAVPSPAGDDDDEDGVTFIK